ncbi:MAG: D-alanyl-D-alanine carboxypeptidase family protein [Pseudomonadota bacterium]
MKNDQLMRLNTMLRSCVALVISLINVSVQAVVPVPQVPDVASSSYIVMDYETGHIIAEKNSNTPLPPASLTKIMTSYVVAHELNQGNISLDDQVRVSEKAWAKNLPGASLMFIEVDKDVSVRDLLRGIIVSSGSDASVAIAEHIAGTEEAFADLMNLHAQRLGMTESTFQNSNGLPADDHFTSARDMALLSRALIKKYPEVYSEYAIKEFTFNGIKQYNRNRLLWDKSLNVDGIKTGHTEAAGYCLVSSATNDGMRLITVVMGTASEAARARESKKLLNFGFRFYETVEPFKKSVPLHTERVWMGEQENIALGILDTHKITLTKGQRKSLKAEFDIDERLIAPINKGQKVGTLYIKLEDKTLSQVPLVALNDVPEAGWFSRLIDWFHLQIVKFFS